MAITAKCQHKCAGDRDCTCNGLVKHQHHICRDAASGAIPRKPTGWKRSRWSAKRCMCRRCAEWRKAAMPQHHNIATTPPPVATWLQVFWWGENRWITARFDGTHWRDELGRIVQGPVVYWREITQ